MSQLVSVIIPAYNAEKFIGETIVSVLKQSHSNLELIIINDGSKDNTLSILNHFAESDKRIRLLNKTNTGVSDTRNKGIELAKGEFIAFLDADDVWLENNLEKKVDLLSSNPQLGFVYSNMYQADKDLQNRTLAPEGKDNNILEDLLMWNGEVIPGPCSNLVIRRKCIEHGIRFDPRLTTIADQDFTVQLAHQFKGKLIPEPLWVYRILPGSMSKSLQVMEEDALTVFSIYQHKKYFHSEAFMKKCFTNMYLIVSGSWFKDGKNFIKGSQFLFKALARHPVYAMKGLGKRLIKKFS
jgi:glycosyltransferase involved in cell wall biosynthesis